MYTKRSIQKACPACSSEASSGRVPSRSAVSAVQDSLVMVVRRPLPHTETAPMLHAQPFRPVASWPLHP